MKENLHQLMELADVCGIYIVDDAVNDQGVNDKHFIGLLKKVQAAGKFEELDEMEDEFEFENNAPILESYAKDLWAEADETKRLQYVRQLCDMVPYKEDEDLTTNLGFARVLEQLRQEEGLPEVKLRTITPTTWDNELTTIGESIPEGKKAIVLFDQKLELAGDRFLVIQGIDLVEEVKSSSLKDRFLTGILTYTVPDESLELTERNKLTADKNIDPSLLFVLTKKRLENLPHLVDGIKKMLLDIPCEQIKDKAITISEEAQKSTKDKLKKLDTYDFNHTVLQSSLKEGVWAPDTLFRIVDIIYKDEIKRHIFEKNLIPELNLLLRSATSISQIAVDVQNAEVYTEKYALRRQELYAEGDLINGLFKPLENGDIFQIKNGGLYILLGQSCDFVIRSDGERAARVGYLLKIKTRSREEITVELEKAFKRAKLQKLQDFNYWKTKGVLEYIDLDHQKIGVVDLPQAHVVDLDVLDLVTFNTNGEAVINTGAKAKPPVTLHIGLHARHIYLKEKYEKLKDNIDIWQKAVSSIPAELLKSMPSNIKHKLKFDAIPNLSLTDTLGEPSLNGNTFQFGVQRVKSLRDPYAKNLLDKYTRYLSRTGDLHDFTETEKSEKLAIVSSSSTEDNVHVAINPIS